jgi:hypothetical protein
MATTIPSKSLTPIIVGIIAAPTQGWLWFGIPLSHLDDL